MLGFARAAILLSIVTTPLAAAQPSPNIVVIFTDDHGYADLSSQEVVDDIRTPHIDNLAARGARMTSGYVTAPQCVPSRAGLLTGRYQNRFGLESNGLPLAGFNRQLTIAERLKRAGYATGMTGKWHLGPAHEVLEHGFDDVYYKNANRPGWANFTLDGADREGGPEHSRLYHLDANTAAACAFIKRHRDEPFFFYCAYRAPHVPLDAPQKYLKRFPGKMPQRRRQALAMMSAVDDGVGKIVKTLADHGLTERTLLFFIGDNGAPLKIHKLDLPGGGPGWDGSLNDPLNGEKGMLSEGGIRVPYVVCWPGRIPAGKAFDHPVISLDVAATAVAAAGLPKDDTLDGVDLIPHLSGELTSPPHEHLYWRWIAQSAVRRGQWKYLRGGEREYLFDLSRDVSEQHNVAAQHPDIAAELKASLVDWAGELKPPGLATKSMSETWSRYFDHYLDGKPAPRPNARNAAATTFQQWVVRNGTALKKDGALQITPASRNRKPFLALNKLRITGPVVATVRLRAPRRGRLALSWREQGQRDFSSTQAVSLAVEPSSEWQEVRLQLPTQRTVIHVRLSLPSGAVALRQVEFKGSRGSSTTDFSGK